MKFRNSLLGAAALALIATAALAATQTLSIGTSTGPGGILQLFGSTSGSTTLQPPAVAGSVTLTLPPTAGTNGQGLITDGTGVLTFGAVGGSGCTVSGTGAVFSSSGTCAVNTNITASAGALSLGASGTVGTLALGNATSGTVTIGTATGALGSVTATLPANTGTIAELNLAQTWSATQTFGAVVGTINTQSGTTYTLAATDCGKTILFTSASAITLTTLNSLPAGCAISVEQGGAGQITLANGSGATSHSAHSYTKTFAQYAIIGLFVDTNTGSAADIIITGDGA